MVSIPGTRLKIQTPGAARGIGEVTRLPQPRTAARNRWALLLAVAGLLTNLLATCISAADDHPQRVTVNGKDYNWPKAPVVVVLIDGGDPAYVSAGLAQGLLPHFQKFMHDGFASVAVDVMPSFTNPNNISVITGVPPSVHGISGNFFLNPANGQETMMDQPEFMRADSILARFSEQGAKVVAITAKNKLARMLAYKLQNGITFSAERADTCRQKENGIGDCLAYVEKPLPNVYSGDVSLFVLEAGVKILQREKPDLMYLSLSDYIQHKYAPGSKEATQFYVAVDDYLGRLAALGAIVGLTGDHGMNDKTKADGSPNIIFLQDLLDSEFGSGKTRVILPITDPYVKHHDALGSYATVFLQPPVSATAAMKLLNRQPGVELVLNRASAARKFDLPADRIGDLVVVSDRGAVLGKSKATLDLSELGGMRLRSHGGLADRYVYLIFSQPLNDTYADIALSRRLRNYDVFDFALNGLR
ncbi:MAG TPA: phosphonoacetate hydrolase [Candidatus Nitrosotalea sp.]|nr:phosphonoacetate hydrolase [Candidatus Nitrosotalea sp.]